MSKRIRSVALPIIGAVVGNAIAPGVGGAYGAALGSGANTYSQTHNLGKALLSAGGSYVGNNLGTALGGVSPTVTGAMQSALGPDIGSAIGQALGGNIALTPLSSVIGSQVGSNLASSLVPQTTKNAVGQNPSAANAVTKFTAKRETEQEMPLTIKGLGSLDPKQASTNIATQGVYGGGEGPEENSYFLNLINRRLVDDAGKVDSDLSDVNPVENSFLAQLGLGGYSNATDLLQAISKYNRV